ncbi:MAG: c-type cytochrome [Myxococcota bacterium]
MRRAFESVGLAASLAVVALLGCRGTTSAEPPVHLNPNMDWQQYVEAQERNNFFADERGMRPPVEGTVARASVEPTEDDEHLAADDHLYRGRDGEAEEGLPHGRLVDDLPDQIELDEALVERGRERYNVFCAPCHSESGDGDGIVAERGLQVEPTSYHSDELRAMPLGYFFDVITHGVRTMEPYAAQIPVEDRWAIAVWVRALQVSHAVPEAQVPADQRKNTEGAGQ